MAPNPLSSLPVIEPLTRPWSPSWKYYSNISKQFEEILLNNISDDLHKKVFFWAVSEKGEGGGTYQNFWYLMYLWSNSSEKLYKLPKFSEGRSSLAIKKMTEPFFFLSASVSNPWQLRPFHGNITNKITTEDVKTEVIQ